MKNQAVWKDPKKSGKWKEEHQNNSLFKTALKNYQDIIE